MNIHFRSYLISFVLNIILTTYCLHFSRHQKHSIVIPVDQLLYAKHPSNSPSPQPQRKMKDSLHRVKSASSVGSLAAVSPALSPYLSKKDSSDYEVFECHFDDVFQQVGNH